jgi:hypothetical protein
MTYLAVSLGLIVLLGGILNSCGHTPGKESAHHNSSDVNSSLTSSQKNDDSQDIATLCNRLPEIKVMPIKSERGEDPIYDAFMRAGNSAVPCLIDRVVDVNPMPDPRSEPGYADVEFKVGDLAYFLVIDITKLDFTELLPSKVRKEYESDGVYAYFKFVRNPANRRKLQDSLRTWYQKNQK